MSLWIFLRNKRFFFDEFFWKICLTNFETLTCYNPSTSHGSPRFILLLQEVTWQCRSFLPAGWLKSLCIWKRSRQQLNNLYWVIYKSCHLLWWSPVGICALNWRGQKWRNWFSIKVSHKRKDSVGWLLSFISQHVINPKRRLRILSKDPNYCHLSQRCLKTKVPQGTK